MTVGVKACSAALISTSARGFKTRRNRAPQARRTRTGASAVVSRSDDTSKRARGSRFVPLSPVYR